MARPPAADLPEPEPLSQLFMRRAARAADQVAHRSLVDGRWRPAYWRDVREQVEAYALGLLSVGAGPGTAVAIMSGTRPEWSHLDMANLCIGAVTVGLYPSLSRDQARQVLELSGARIVIVEDRAKRQLIEAATQDFDSPVTIITMEGDSELAPSIGLAEVARRGRSRRALQPEEIARRVAERRSDEVVSYIYTDGTTAAPKGAMLSHRNFHYVIQATNALVPYGGERALVFLPMANSLQRYASYLNLMVDVDIHYGGALNRIFEDLKSVGPTCFAAVPRMLEDLHAGVMAKVLGGPRFQRAGVRRAVAAMHAAAHRLREGREPGVGGRLRARVADRLVGRQIRDLLGGTVKFIGSGGAPLSPDVHAFFEDVRVPVLVGYGLTETCAPACLNTLDNRRIGTVGRPLPGTEVRVDEDGEILIRGPGVFQGYYRNPEATAQAFTDDGWFRTGDVGTMSRDGFLTITDRKSNLIMMSSGDNVAPQPLEMKLRRHPWIEQAMVVGHGRPYLSALLSLDAAALPDVAQQFGLRTLEPSAVAAHPEFQAAIERHLATVNAEQPPGRKIQRFMVLPDMFTATTGELTPSAKVKRRVVTQRRHRAIERLYRP